MHPLLVKVLLIGAGGALGAVARYGLAGLVQRVSADFPYGTMSVNVLGCLVIGIVGAYFAGPALVREEWRLAILIGLLGGFTTFSTFSFETFQLMNDGAWTRAGANVLLTNFLCLSTTWIGYRLTEHFVGP
jgi:CrcB protein